MKISNYTTKTVKIIALGLLVQGLAHSQTPTKNNVTCTLTQPIDRAGKLLNQNLEIFLNPTGFQSQGYHKKVFLSSEVKKATYFQQENISNVEEITFITQYTDPNTKLVSKKLFYAAIKAGMKKIYLKLFDQSAIKTFSDVELQNIDGSYKVVPIEVNEPSSEEKVVINAQFSCQ